MKSWNNIRQEKVPEDQEAAAAASREALAVALELAELRASRGLTQAALAERLGKRQSTVSELERRDDVFVKSLREYVEALGGKLEIRAIFEEDEIPLAIAAG